jgi:hypothetical protein
MLVGLPIGHKKKTRKSTFLFVKLGSIMNNLLSYLLIFYFYFKFDFYFFNCNVFDFE